MVWKTCFPMCVVLSLSIKRRYGIKIGDTAHTGITEALDSVSFQMRMIIAPIKIIDPCVNLATSHRNRLHSPGDGQRAY